MLTSRALGRREQTLNLPEELFPLQRDRVNMTTVIRLVAVYRTPIAVEAVVGVCVEADIVDHKRAGVSQSHADESGEIEHRVAVARRWNEEQRVLGIGRDEAFNEFGADFIGVLPDQWADRRDDAGSFGAKFEHRLYGGFDNAGQRAFPPRMRRSDHACVRIGKQDRAAVGGGDADGKTFCPCDQRVAARARGVVTGAGYHDGVGRMDLPEAEKMRRGGGGLRPRGGTPGWRREMGSARG